MKPAEKVVAYFYDDEIGNFCYGGGNPMRPHRARMAYTLVDSYGLTKKMALQRPRPRDFDELTLFHADDYINFLRGVTPNTVDENMTQLRRFNMGIAGEADCPVFDGMYEYCQTYAGGSVDGAAQLASGNADITFNWSGGMHHAKKAEASGFCYVNDIVLGILELLKTYARVLYVDIDIHHGDGVEEAFYLTDRVMTVSFHKYGEFFPGTGALDDIGYGKGKYYTVNVPLKDGMDDDSYKMLYEPIMQKVMDMYQPGAIVMCCGADSLSGDRLGCFNLSLEGHSNCLEFLAKFNVPMMILGGGGYTLRNVARCWCYETGRMMGIDLPDVLPERALEDFNMYLDTQRLRIAVSNMKNANDRRELEETRDAVLEHLCRLPPVPSAQMAYVPPPVGRASATEGLPEEDPDVRGGGPEHEAARRVRDGDESDGEEGSGRGGFGDDPSGLAGGRVSIRYPGEQQQALERPAAAPAAAAAEPMDVEGGSGRPAAAAAAGVSLAAAAAVPAPVPAAPPAAAPAPVRQPSPLPEGAPPVGAAGLRTVEDQDAQLDAVSGGGGSAGGAVGPAGAQPPLANGAAAFPDGGAGGGAAGDDGAMQMAGGVVPGGPYSIASGVRQMAGARPGSYMPPGSGQ
ncbi:hypothetical protein HYH03_014150 [Edaphochlamys debaryana]|uniref:histone deacetylase n=1 Tax=Edaphochlamys debaryana TaxID=47281 RepID=A0A836BTS2_9CHLO|nr:hypothetical protein HYH03_014150 [Edaphochlamys debaryana]|eukprot:KAG2487168.1 hypothetical protein HYH03_014150 [Edaphochlamys debaryana]